MAYSSNTETVVGGGFSGSLNGGSTQYGVVSAPMVKQDMGAISTSSATTVVSAGAADATTVNTVSVTLTPARALQVVCSGAATAHVVVTGTDCWGATATENFTLNGTNIVYGHVAFKTVTSWYMVTAAAAGRTINIGDTDIIGLWYPISSVGQVAVVSKTDGSLAQTGAADANVITVGSSSANADPRGTVKMVTNVPNSSKTFSIFYTPSRTDSISAT